MKPQKIVVIDIATIYKGRGGTGGGIWSYVSNLLIHLDLYKNDYPGLSVICLANVEFNFPLKNIKVRKMNADFSNLFIRMLYIHLYLPIFCLFKNGVLHKVTSEVPWFSIEKTIVSVHDFMALFYKNKHYHNKTKSGNLKNWYFGLIDNRAIKKGYLIFTQSNFIKQEIIENYKIDPEKIITTYPAVTVQSDSFFFNATTKSNIQIYCVAAFHRHKGHLRLIDVFEKIIEQHNLPALLFLRGHIPDQEYYNEVKIKVAKSNAKNFIKFIDYDPNVKTSQIYSNADWVILLSEYEGFGLPVIEAQAFGVPVICSDIGVFKEIAADSVIYVANDLDSSNAAERLYNVIKNEKLREEIIKKGLENHTRFSWHRLGKQMLEIYQSVSEQ